MESSTPSKKWLAIEASRKGINYGVLPGPFPPRHDPWIILWDRESDVCTMHCTSTEYTVALIYSTT